MEQLEITSAVFGRNFADIGGGMNFRYRKKKKQNCMLNLLIGIFVGDGPVSIPIRNSKFELNTAFTSGGGK